MLRSCATVHYIKRLVSFHALSAANKEDMAAHHALFVMALKGHSDAVNGIAWSPDGTRLASACDDLTIRVFDLQDLSSKDPKFR